MAEESSSAEEAERGGRRKSYSARAAALDAASNINRVAAIEANHRAELTTGERVAAGIAGFCGSITFVYIHVAWFAAWILLNTLSERFQFDPYPFTFLTLVVSLEAIFLSTFILISQNHETRLTERRNHLDLQINLLAEQESTKTLELLQLVAEKLGIDCSDDAATEALLTPTDPEELLKEIIEVSESTDIADAVNKVSKASQ
jgi:uncharacterized membrane protein